MGLFIKGKAMIGVIIFSKTTAWQVDGEPSIINSDLTWPRKSHFSKIILSIHSKKHNKIPLVLTHSKLHFQFHTP